MWLGSLLRGWKVKSRCWSGWILGWRRWGTIGPQVPFNRCRIQFLAVVELTFHFLGTCSPRAALSSSGFACIPYLVIPSMSSVSSGETFTPWIPVRVCVSPSYLPLIARPSCNLLNLRRSGTLLHLQNPFTATLRSVFAWISRGHDYTLGARNRKDHLSITSILNCRSYKSNLPWEKLWVQYEIKVLVTKPKPLEWKWDFS